MILPLLKSQVTCGADRVLADVDVPCSKTWPLHLGQAPRLCWSEKSTGSPDSAACFASSPKSNSSFQLSISSSYTSLSSAVNGQPALERKPSSGPIFLSRRKASASAISNAPAAGNLA